VLNLPRVNLIFFQFDKLSSDLRRIPPVRNDYIAEARLTPGE